MSEWISVKDRLPEFDTPVWLFEPGIRSMYVGERGLAEDGWLWGNCYYSLYYTGEKWESYDCEQDDDYHPTHWMPLPLPPDHDKG